MVCVCACDLCVGDGVGGWNVCVFVCVGGGTACIGGICVFVCM